MKVIFYIISVSLQISGALLLMLFSLSTNRKKVIDRFINKNIVSRHGEKINYNKGELKSAFKNAYLSKFSFGFIALGYLVGVFGNIDNCSYLTVIIGIVALTLIFMGLAYLMTFLIVKYSHEVNKKMTNDELKKYNIEPTQEFATNEDIDKLFSD